MKPEEFCWPCTMEKLLEFATDYYNVGGSDPCNVINVFAPNGDE